MLNQTFIPAQTGQSLLAGNHPPAEHHTENLKVYYNTANQILHVIWQGRVKSKEFREGYTHILHMVRMHKPSKWVLDLQSREGIRKEDQLWVFRNIFPQILRLLKRDVFIAVILPVALHESLIHDIDGDDFIDDGNLLIMQHFLYYEESLRWLQGIGVQHESA